VGIMGKLHSLIGYVVVACAFSSGSAAEGLAGSDRDLPVKNGWMSLLLSMTPAHCFLMSSGLMMMSSGPLFCVFMEDLGKGSKKFMHL